MNFSVDKTRQPDVSWDGFAGWVYNEAEDFERASGLFVRLSGSHGRVKAPYADRIYLVLSGKVEFDIDGGMAISQPGDMIVVPRDTPYDDHNRDKNSDSELFLVHAPAFDFSKEVYFNEKEEV